MFEATSGIQKLDAKLAAQINGGFLSPWWVGKAVAWVADNVSFSWSDEGNK